VTRWSIEGHAIISDDDCIADRDGRMPLSLRNDADWTYFQRHLDAAAIVVTGRKGHEAYPNKPGRRRLVFTANAGDSGFAREGDLSFVDPARFDIDEAFGTIAPGGGTIAVAGGTSVFDWFAERRLFAAFHLGRARGVVLPQGRPLFSRKTAAEKALNDIGLILSDRRRLDLAAQVDMLVYRRA
jgi:dihydrofolate reductase